MEDPQNGWFIQGNPPKWMMTGGTPILGLKGIPVTALDI